MGARCQDAGNTLSLINPIHLPSPRGNPSCPFRSFSWALPCTNPDDFGFHSCGPNVWEPHYLSPRCYGGGWQQRVQAWHEAPPRVYICPSLLQTHQHQCKRDSRALIVGLVPYSSCGWDWSHQGLGFSTALSQGRATANGAWNPMSCPSPLMWKAKLAVAKWRVTMSHKPPRY